MSLMLKGVLTHMFGPLSRWAQERIAAAQREQLLAWGTTLAGAKSLESVIGLRR